MEENTRNPERAEDLLKILSVFVAVASFWVIALYWNYIFLDDLEFVPRLGLGAALSWVVFLHVEATGMIIMSMMREKWRSEAREARREARLELAEARVEVAEGRAREAQAHAETSEARAREAQAHAEAARLEARAEAAEGRAREAQAKLEAQEVISDLRRQLREARGEGANGAADA